MGFVERIGNGWNLGRQSLSLIWNDKTLMLFPLFSAICSLGAVAAFYFGIGPDQLQVWLESVDEEALPEQIPIIGWIAAFVLYFLLYFITVFFNVALIGCARLSMTGQDTTVLDGLSIAGRHLPSILIWTLVSGSVGVLLSAIESEKRVGRLIRSILGTAWSILTFFVVPVMIFEKCGVFGSIRRSAKIMARTWGENLVAQFSLELIFFVLSLPFVGLIIFATVYGSDLLGLLLCLGVLYIVCVAILSAAAKSVLVVALYEYATAGQTLRGFHDRDLKRSFTRE